MFSFHICKPIGDDLYDEKININKLDYFIKEYSLIDHGEIKEYWINNVEILKNNQGSISYHYIIDKSVIYDKIKNIIIREYDIKNCNEFQFYNSDYEIDYRLYKSNINGIEILVKDFKLYLTIEYNSDNKNNIYENINFNSIDL